jgi:hypothetical protein
MTAHVRIALACFAFLLAGLFAGALGERHGGGAVKPPPPCHCKFCEPGEDDYKGACGVVYEPHPMALGRTQLVPRVVNSVRFAERMRVHAGDGSWCYYQPDDPETMRPPPGR